MLKPVRIFFLVFVAAVIAIQARLHAAELVTLSQKNYQEYAPTGKEADAALSRANITVNKNSVPNDPQSPFVTSGLRIGSPAITTRGFSEAESRDLANWICDILDDMGNDDVVATVKGKVQEICQRLPVYRG